MSDEVFSISLERSDDAAIIRLIGELDLHTVESLSSSLVESPQTEGIPIIIDTSGLAFVDSSGVRGVVDMYLRLTSAEVPAVVVISEMMRRVLEVGGGSLVMEDIPIAESVEEARERLGSGESAGW